MQILEKQQLKLLLLLVLSSVLCTGCPSQKLSKMQPPNFNPAVQRFDLSGVFEQSVFLDSQSWRFNFGGLNEKGAKNLIVSCTVGVNKPGLLKLRDYLLQLNPTALVRDETNVWIEFTSSSNGMSLFLPCVQCPDEIKNRFATDESTKQFLKYFSGLRCELPNYAGYFLDNKCIPFKVVLGESSPSFSQAWQESIVFYHAANGDLLLRRTDGKMAWYTLSENRLSEFESSFSEVILAFVSCHESGLIFDSYSFALDKQE